MERTRRIMQGLLQSHYFILIKVFLQKQCHSLHAHLVFGIKLFIMYRVYVL